jgi:hypothetical protein
VVDQRDNTAADEPECRRDYCALVKSRLERGEVTPEFRKNIEAYGGSGDCPFGDQVRVHMMDARSQSKGPVVARANGHSLLEDEDFCLQVDSHMTVVYHWDEELVHDWELARNEYAVVTTYVHADTNIGKFWGTNKWNGPWKHDVPHICRTQWGDSNLVRNQQAAAARNLEVPKLNFLWAAGFSFAKCHFDEAAPYDPNLYHIFDGEEFSRMLRAWTRGYDSYTPKRNIVFHNYTAVPHFWTQDQTPEEAKRREVEHLTAVGRLRTLFQQEGAPTPPVDLGRYGLGTCRTYDEFAAFSGLDPRIMKATEGDFCGDLNWVNYHEDTCDIGRQAPPRRGGDAPRPGAADGRLYSGLFTPPATQPPRRAADPAKALDSSSSSPPAQVRNGGHHRSHFGPDSLTADIGEHIDEIKAMLFADLAIVSSIAVIFFLCMQKKAETVTRRKSEVRWATQRVPFDDEVDGVAHGLRGGGGVERTPAEPSSPVHSTLGSIRDRRNPPLGVARAKRKKQAPNKRKD